VDGKTPNALSDSLALLQIQLNTLLLMFQAQHPTVPMRDLSRRPVDEGVELAGPHTMQRFQDRLRQDIVFQNLRDIGLEDLWRRGEGASRELNASEHCSVVVSLVVVVT
jgi:hypothetical protein